MVDGSATAGKEVGAILEEGGVRFRVWAPEKERVEVVRLEDGREAASYPLAREDQGYHAALIPGLGPGTRYKYRVDGEGPFPDPASRFQPDGVHAPSEVIDPDFEWNDHEWTGIAPETLIIYELHVGTATAEGTFEGLIPYLPYFKDLGVTALELMPVAAFPGKRNWGYDGVSLWAPSAIYGGPVGLKRLVNAAHAQGLAVLLDLVYNHLGPDGNYLGVYSSYYFSERHHTPWGAALNFDGPHAGQVRDFYIRNTLYWLESYHLDGARYDATHEIIDDSDPHILRELVLTVQRRFSGHRRIVLTAEDDRNEAAMIRAVEEGGIGLDAVWADDFHHQVRRAVAGDQEGYYAFFSGSIAHLARTINRGWYFEGERKPGTDEHRGTSASGLPLPAFIHCIQNHDQIGNRAMGERLNHDVDPAAYRAVSALLLIDPATPLLFMGQEWAATSPFLYFTDHHEELGKLVTEGRRAEFAHFSAFADPETRNRIPDPQAEETFLRSRLDWEEREKAPHAEILRLYHDLLAIRRTHTAMQRRSREAFRAFAIGNRGLALLREGGQEKLLLLVNLGDELVVNLAHEAVTRDDVWEPLLSTEDARYGGTTDFNLDASLVTLPSPGAVILEARRPQS